jgi:uncharacterized protein YxjI
MLYLVRERLFSSGDDSWVTDERGDQVFLVDGKALRLRETFELRDASGAVLATIRKKFLAFTDTLEIEHDGAVAATVRKALLSPLHHRANIEIPGRGNSRRSGTSSTRTSRSGTGARSSRRSPDRGSGSGTPTGWTWRRARTTR